MLWGTPLSLFTNVIVNGTPAGTARQSLSNSLFSAEIVSAVPSGAHCFIGPLMPGIPPMPGIPAMPPPAGGAAPAATTVRIGAGVSDVSGPSQLTTLPLEYVCASLNV